MVKHRRSLSARTSNERGEMELSETEIKKGGTGSNFTLKIMTNFQVVKKYKTIITNYFCTLFRLKMCQIE